MRAGWVIYRARDSKLNRDVAIKVLLCCHDVSHDGQLFLITARPRANSYTLNLDWASAPLEERQIERSARRAVAVHGFHG